MYSVLSQGEYIRYFVIANNYSPYLYTNSEYYEYLSTSYLYEYEYYEYLFTSYLHEYEYIQIPFYQLFVILQIQIITYIHSQILFVSELTLPLTLVLIWCFVY